MKGLKALRKYLQKHGKLNTAKLLLIQPSKLWASSWPVEMITKYLLDQLDSVAEHNRIADQILYWLTDYPFLKIQPAIQDLPPNTVAFQAAALPLPSLQWEHLFGESPPAFFSKTKD